MAEGVGGLVLGTALGAVCGFILALLLANRGPVEGGAPSEETERLQEELDAQAEALRLLPEVLRQMLTAAGRRGAVPLALHLADELLRPEQSAIFMARPAQRRLGLAEGRGLPEALAPGFELEYGQGRVGHVAETRRAMDEGDFRGVSALLKRQLAATEVAGLRVDIASPIEDDTGLVGVLTVGGVRAGRGAAKALLKMVAEVAAVVLAQQARLRAVEEAASQDGLTGVYNKRHLRLRLEEELQRDAPLSLLVLDLDHFRGYNDAAGHREGDELLRRMGQLLRGSVREGDVAARYGGEEFAILYSGTPKAHALRLAEGIRHAVESHAFPHRHRQPLGAITVSGGVASFPEDGREAGALILAAETALAEAKAAGRNRIQGAGGSNA